MEPYVFPTGDLYQEHILADTYIVGRARVFSANDSNGCRTYVWKRCEMVKPDSLIETHPCIA